MNVTAFLDHINKKKHLPEKSVIYFAGFGDEYPLLFFSQVIAFLQKQNTLVETISLETEDDAAIKVRLSTMGFQGPVFFWFNDIYTVSAKKQRDWINYFKTYTGPHCILFFCNDESSVSSLKNSNNCIDVVLPKEVSLQDLSTIRFLVNDKTEKTNSPVDTGLCMQVMSLNTLCLLSYYERVAGRNWSLFLKEWGPLLFDSTNSLFLLSQYFFGKKIQPFFSRWSHSYDLYMPPFWPSFWADQLWRAYVYCDLMQKKQYADAKKVQYKLPFSFINRDWSSFTLTELKNAHHYVCALDYSLKNGGSPAALELFFDKFFGNVFRVQEKL